MSRFSPDKRFRVLMVNFDIMLDSSHQFIDTLKVSPTDPARSQDPKPNLNLIHPRGSNWSGAPRALSRGAPP